MTVVHGLNTEKQKTAAEGRLMFSLLLRFEHRGLNSIFTYICCFTGG